LRLFSFGGYGLALAALALMVFGAIECPPFRFTRICFEEGFSMIFGQVSVKAKIKEKMLRALAKQ